MRHDIRKEQTAKYKCKYIQSVQKIQHQTTVPYLVELVRLAQNTALGYTRLKHESHPDASYINVVIKLIRTNNTDIIRYCHVNSNMNYQNSTLV